MKLSRLFFKSLIISATFMAFSVAANAQAQRTFVSAEPGTSDNSACSRAQPCRTFDAAVTAVASGGEVVALSSGGYGAVTITKSVQLIAPAGVVASVTQNASGGNAITVAAGASDTVVLRGLTLNGANNFGINFDSGAALYVENCVLSGFFRGILFDAPGKLFVKDTLVRNGFIGIYVSAPSGGTVQATLDHIRAENNSSSGVLVANSSGATRVSISDSIAAGNSLDGFFISGGSATISRSTAANNGRHGFDAGATSSPTAMLLDSCVATGNGDTGVYASSGISVPATVRVANSVATDNATGFGQNGGSIFESFGNNRARGNRTSDTTGVITPVGQI